jgi:fructose-bisphosphate aldolase class II
VPVILHTDHAAKKWLPWISALIDAGEQFYKEKGQPLYSSHMLDLSEEPIEENIETSVEFFKRMAPLGMSIEIELGVTGGEEDGVDNSGIENDKLYTQPEHVAYSYEELGKGRKVIYGSCGLRKCTWCLQSRQCGVKTCYFKKQPGLYSKEI